MLAHDYSIFNQCFFLILKCSTLSRIYLKLQISENLTKDEKEKYRKIFIMKHCEKHKYRKISIYSETLCINFVCLNYQEL